MKTTTKKVTKSNTRLDVSEPPFSLYRSLSNKPTFREGFTSVVNLLKGKKNIIVLTGAGISTSCGLPDFRTKGSGLYSKLDPFELGLSCPEELFDLHFFLENPEPFYKFARNLYYPLGTNERVIPSDSHKLLSLFEQRKMLLRVYSQNIDGLEETAGISPKKIIYAHGSLQWATCLTCKRRVSAEEIQQNILEGTVAYCRAAVTTTAPQKKHNKSTRKRSRDEPSRTCNGILKPGVTFFGEALHDGVRRALEADRNKVDALVVIGTSLSVAPISKVISYLPPSVPRILINRTFAHPAHRWEDSSDTENEDKEFRNGYIFDAYLLGFCDDVTRALGKQLFSDEDPPELDEGRLLATLDENDENFNLEEFQSVDVPRERVFLFPGATAASGEDMEDAEYHEIAHCDGCSDRISGTVHKCNTCFDYDLCSDCYPKLSKTHYDGKHSFHVEAIPPAITEEGR